MDVKMDMRLKRNEISHPRKLIKDGVLIVDRALTNEELLSLLDEFYI
jgi:iron only hydrogenase large subunit-like protein